VEHTEANSPRKDQNLEEEMIRTWSWKTTKSLSENKYLQNGKWQYSIKQNNGCKEIRGNPGLVVEHFF
jgi:hypothetical protein